MRKKLSVNDELTSVVRLFEIADRCAKAKEALLAQPAGGASPKAEVQGPQA
jgi:hypothetical protein